MTDKPNSPIRRVSVSKAPPPINPIRVGRYTAPNAPPVPPPNWDKWGHMRDVELWEAVALSLNLEPDKLPVYLAAFERFGDDPFRICPQSFLDRLQVANSNCGISLGYRPVHKLKARCLVDLPAFGAWAVNQNIPDMPPKLAALAATEPQAAPIVPINKLTGLPFCEALEQPAYQKTPDYQARCKKALLVLNEISEVEKDRTNSFDERERKSQRLAALKVELAEINFPGDSQQKTIEPQATTPSPAPVVNSKRNKNKPSIETVALDYMCAEFKQGQFQSAAKFHKHLIKSVGVKDSPFEMGTGTNALKLFCPAAGSFFDVGTLGNVWPKIRAS